MLRSLHIAGLSPLPLHLDLGPHLTLLTGDIGQEVEAPMLALSIMGSILSRSCLPALSGRWRVAAFLSDSHLILRSEDSRVGVSGEIYQADSAGPAPFGPIWYDLSESQWSVLPTPITQRTLCFFRAEGSFLRSPSLVSLDEPTITPEGAGLARLIASMIRRRDGSIEKLEADLHRVFDTPCHLSVEPTSVERQSIDWLEVEGARLPLPRRSQVPADALCLRWGARRSLLTRPPLGVLRAVALLSLLRYPTWRANLVAVEEVFLGLTVEQARRLYSLLLDRAQERNTQIVATSRPLPIGFDPKYQVEL